MFVISEEERGIPRNQEERVLLVLRSINEPEVAAAERPAEPTQAFICRFQKENGRVGLRIVLYQPRSQVRLIYLPEEPDVEEARQKEVEVDALDFVESMGFTMDNLNLAKKEEAERKKLLADLPIFEGEIEVESSQPILDGGIQDLEPEEAVFDGAVAAGPVVVEEDIPILDEAQLSDSADSVGIEGSLSMMDELEAEFSREEDVDTGEMNASLSSVLAAAAEKPEEVGGVGRWKTIVRFLASF